MINLKMISNVAQGYIDQGLPDGSGKPGDDFLRWLCAGLAANSRN